MTDALETLVWLRFLRFSSLFRGRKRKQDKGLASEPTLRPVTSARTPARRQVFRRPTARSAGGSWAGDVRAVDGGFSAVGCGAF